MPRLFRVLVMVMTSPNVDKDPSIFLKPGNDFTAVHKELYTLYTPRQGFAGLKFLARKVKHRFAPYGASAFSLLMPFLRETNLIVYSRPHHFWRVCCTA